MAYCRDAAARRVHQRVDKAWRLSAGGRTRIQPASGSLPGRSSPSAGGFEWSQECADAGPPSQRLQEMPRPFVEDTKAVAKPKNVHRFTSERKIWSGFREVEGAGCAVQKRMALNGVAKTFCG